jgi:membrane protein implicated in regulation of membrane protease activity
MRTGLAYTSARILIFAVALALLDLAGARGVLLLALAFLISALVSYVLLSKQREAMAGALNRRLRKATGRLAGKAAEFRERLEEGAAAEDDQDAGQPEGTEQAVR